MSVIPRMLMGYSGTSISARLLDTYSGAVAAYSVARQLKASAQYAIRVRHSGDSYASATDIGFSAGAMNTASLATLVGSGTGVIETLYDQISTSNLSQSTNANRPTIVSAGVLQTNGTNGKASAVFDSTDLLDTTASRSNFGTDLALAGNVAWTAFIVHKKTTSTAGCLFGWGDVFSALGAAGMYDDGTLASVAFAGTNDFTITGPTNNTNYLTTIIKTAGAINTTTSAYRNTTSVASTPHSTNTPNVSGGYPLQLARWANYTSNGLQGHIQELIIFVGDKSADRAAIEADINTFYGIY